MRDELFPFKPDQPTVTPSVNPSWKAIKETRQGQFDAMDRAMITEVVRLREENAKLKDNLLAESIKLDEVGELDAKNFGADSAAGKLLDIVKTGDHTGVFGGKLMEECAQAILALRKALEDAQTSIFAAHRWLDEALGDDDYCRDDDSFESCRHRCEHLAKILTEAKDE